MVDNDTRDIMEAYKRDLVNAICLNLIDHLEGIEGVRTVRIGPTKPCSQTEITRWEKENFPHRLPVDLKGLLLTTNGLDVRWSATQADREIDIGKIKINKLADIERSPIDDQEELENAFAAADPTYIQTGTRSFAAFVLDSDEDIGKVVLLFIPGHTTCQRSSRMAVPESLGGQTDGEDRDESEDSDTNYNDSCQVWFQGPGGGWSPLAASAADYLRLAAAHLGVRGWPGALRARPPPPPPPGLEPGAAVGSGARGGGGGGAAGAPPLTEHWMRLYCPERLALNHQMGALIATSAAAAAAGAGGGGGRDGYGGRRSPLRSSAGGSHGGNEGGEGGGGAKKGGHRGSASVRPDDLRPASTRASYKSAHQKERK